MKSLVEGSVPSKCSGCGASFHESNPLLAGYLPQLKQRQIAFMARIPFDEYKRYYLMDTVGLDGKEEQISQSYQRYLLKREHEQSLERATHSDQLLESPATKNVDREEVSGQSKSSSVVEKPAQESLICARCHSLHHHQRLPNCPSLSVELHPDERANQDQALKVFNEVMDRIAIKKDASNVAEGGLVVAICDVLDFPVSLNVDPILKKIRTDRPIVVLVNKIDLLPDVPDKLNILRRYFKKYIQKDLGLKNVVDVHPISALNAQNLDDVIKSIVTLKSPLDDVFIIGSANSGKSTLLNTFLKRLDGPMYKAATTSYLPGTTMDEIPIPLKRFPLIREKFQKFKSTLKRPAALLTSPQVTKLLNGNIIDTPGLPAQHNFQSILTPHELKYCLPTKPLNPVSFYLTPGRSMWIGGLARIDFLEGKAQVIATTMLDPKIPIHTSNILKAEWLWNVHGGGKSRKWGDSVIVPSSAKPMSADELDLDNVRMRRKNENKDIYANIKLTPPFFSDPRQYLVNLKQQNESADASDDKVEKEVDGVLTERMRKYPRFKHAFTHEFKRDIALSEHGHSKLHFKESQADIVLSGIGWISIAGNFSQPDDRRAMFKIYTPNGKGAYLRVPSLTPTEVSKRGPKIRSDANGRYRSP